MVKKTQVTLSGWHVMFFVAAFAVVGTTALWQAFAAPHRSLSGKCTYANGAVVATDLPNNTPLNFYVTDTTTGSRTSWILNQAGNGSVKVSVPAPKSPTTYDITNKVWGNNGSDFKIYAECSAGV